MPDDYLTATDLTALGIDPALVRVLCPWALQLTAIDGSPCWAVADLYTLLTGGDAWPERRRRSATRCRSGWSRTAAPRSPTRTWSHGGGPRRSRYDRGGQARTAPTLTFGGKILHKSPGGGTEGEMSRPRQNDDALVLALACGATVEAAARQADLSERTVYKRLAEPAFQSRVKLVRSDMVRRSAGLLSAAAGQAVQTLLVLMKEPTPPTVRLGAAKAVLELGMKVRELAELEAEVRELEAKVEALGTPDAGRRW